MSQHRYQVKSPSASLAMDIGTDSHKLQLMKASFFADDDYDGKSVLSEQLEGRDSPDQIVPNRPGIRSHLYSAASSVRSLSRGLPSTVSSVLEVPVPNLIVSNMDLELRAAENQVKFNLYYPSMLVCAFNPIYFTGNQSDSSNRSEISTTCCKTESSSNTISQHGYTFG